MGPEITLSNADIFVKNNTTKVKIKWRIANNNTSMLEKRAKPNFSGP
jgi:hypothetical protein